jgi:site-specific DNA recombinase
MLSISIFSQAIRTQLLVQYLVMLKSSSAMTVIKELNKLGVTINAVEQPLDISKSDNKIPLSLNLIMPEVENDRISEKITEGSWRARMNGYWTTQAPKG